MACLFIACRAAGPAEFRCPGPFVIGGWGMADDASDVVEEAD